MFQKPKFTPPANDTTSAADMLRSAIQAAFMGVKSFQAREDIKEIVLRDSGYLPFAEICSPKKPYVKLWGWYVIQGQPEIELQIEVLPGKRFKHRIETKADIVEDKITLIGRDKKEYSFKATSAGLIHLEVTGPTNEAVTTYHVDPEDPRNNSGSEEIFEAFKREYLHITNKAAGLKKTIVSAYNNVPPNQILGMYTQSQIRMQTITDQLYIQALRADTPMRGDDLWVKPITVQDFRAGPTK